MTTTIRYTLLACAALAACGARAPAEPTESEAAQASLFSAAPEAQWELPRRLAEISGMATAPDGRVFAHDDEHAIIHELDAERGRLIKAFALGERPLIGDFEGMAIAPNGDFFLIESTGALYRFREGEDGAHVAYDRLDTGLEHVCEIEGLAYLAARNSLIIACKTLQVRDMRGSVALYAFSPAQPNAAATPWLSLSLEQLAAAGSPRINPSSVEIDPETGRVIVIAARQRMMIEATQDGDILSTRRLGEGHIQAEGATILPDGALLISDEASELTHAQLTRYGRRS